jgi:hypothetical protein
MTACVGAGDVTVVNSEDQLRTSEIQDVLSALSEAFGAVDVTTNSPAAGLQLAPVPVNTTFDVSVPCEAGVISVNGTANGSLDDETLEGDLTLQLSWDFVGCVVTSDYGSITLNGNPSIQFAAQYLFGQEQFTVTATESGGFDFATADGRTGVCPIDLSMGMSYNATTAESTENVTGWVCGRPAEEFAAFLL